MNDDLLKENEQKIKVEIKVLIIEKRKKLESPQLMKGVKAVIIIVPTLAHSLHTSTAFLRSFGSSRESILSNISGGSSLLILFIQFVGSFAWFI